MVVKAVDVSTPWTDYSVTSQESGRTYRVSLRGMENGQSYCSCPDFRTNQLGICKHIFRVQQSAEKKFTKAEIAKPYRRKGISLRMHYGDLNDPTIGIDGTFPTTWIPKLRIYWPSIATRRLRNAKALMKVLRRLEQAGHEVNVYPTLRLLSNFNWCSSN